MIGSAGGLAFEDGADRGRVLVFGTDTNGAYSLMEWTVAPCPATTETDHLDFGPHHHAEIEEVFVIRRGTIDFLLGDTVTTLHPNDVVRVPAGTRHGFLNRSGADAAMLVMFSPGGFEELFVRYRTDQPTLKGEGFVADARRLFATEFET
ncbi:MAG TPA: cupin domain-containing protein [Acidimicrobiia bacterium]